jgi:hypothetical protein
MDERKKERGRLKGKKRDGVRNHERKDGRKKNEEGSKAEMEKRA